MRSPWLWRSLTCCAVGLFAAGNGPHNAAASDSTEVKITARLLQQLVPLNQEATLIVEARWLGDPGKLTIAPLSPPVVTNLNITASSSANIVATQDGREVATRRYEFRLKPETLGMAYVDAVRLNYRDELEKEYTLQTPRLQLKVIDPVAPPRRNQVVPMTVAGIAFFLLLSGGVLWRHQRLKRRAALEAAQQKSISLEESYLQRLKTELDLTAHELPLQYQKLSDLLRRYLREAFELSALAGATDSLLLALEEARFPTDQLDQVKEVLKACDVVKFSGGSAEPNQLARLYTLVEALLRQRRNSPGEKSEPDPNRTH